MALVPKYLLDLIEQKRRIQDLSIMTGLEHLTGMLQRKTAVNSLYDSGKMQRLFGQALKQQALSDMQSKFTKSFNIAGTFNRGPGVAGLMSKQNAAMFTAGNALKAEGRTPLFDKMLGISKTLFEANQSLRSAIEIYSKTRPFRLTSNRSVGLMHGLETAAMSVAAKSFLRGNDKDFEKIADVTTQVAAVAVRRDDTVNVSSQQFESILQTIGQQFDELQLQSKKERRSFHGYSAYYATIISLLIAVFQILQSEWIAKGDKPATIDQVESVRQEFKVKLDSLLRKMGDSALARIACPLRLKPVANSQILLGIRKGEKVIILGQFHKWANISVMDPIDGVPITGWVLKKYIIRRGNETHN